MPLLVGTSLWKKLQPELKVVSESVLSFERQLRRLFLDVSFG